MKYIKYIAIVITFVTVYSCKVRYGFTPADPGIAETFQVNFFPNNAPLNEPGIDIQFTNALQDLIQNQTSLQLVNSGGDLTYEGEIVEYRISPTTATSDNTAAQNRLTIGIQVRFYDKNDEEKDFERRFSFFFDFAGSAQLTGSQKDTAIETIFERITQDIFNESLANW